jgi:phosphoglucomutase
MSEAGIDPRAGQLPEPADLVDVERLLTAYHDERSEPPDPLQRVAFGTSGHRGSSLSGTFTDAHVAAISEAVCRYREGEGIDGPL